MALNIKPTDNNMLKRIFMLLPNRFRLVALHLRAKIIDIYAIKSYSQEGEDMILRRIFEGQERGFYVDVGAHHPRRFSNTYFFYRQGWKGINIEPNPDAIHAFRSDRPGDTNLQLGVSDRIENLTYYLFDEPALNTFDKDIVETRLSTTPYKLVQTIEVPVERLEGILRKYLPENQIIDFLSIDVEGLDFVVLQSNDWKLFRPKCVLVEVLGMSLEGVMNDKIVQFMMIQGYDLFAKTFNTLFFREKNLELLDRDTDDAKL